MKECSVCHQFKSLDEFHIDRSTSCGVKSACILCRKPSKQRHYQNNKTKYKHRYQEFLNRNPNYRSEYYLKNKT